MFPVRLPTVCVAVATFFYPCAGAADASNSSTRNTGYRLYRASQEAWRRRKNPRRETPVLAVALAGMDASLDHEHRHPARIGARRNQGQHGPSFRGSPEFDASDGVRPPSRERFAQALHLVSSSGRAEARLLRYCGQDLIWHRGRILRDPALLERRKQQAGLAL